MASTPSLTRRAALGAIAAGVVAAVRAEDRPKRLLLRSSWQTVNIGDIAHTPGMLRLLADHHPAVAVTLWPSGDGVAELLRARFPRLQIALTAAERDRALADCDFCLHGSGPGLVGAREMNRWRGTGKPYGFGGVTLSDAELRTHRDLFAGARFVFCRDTESLRALQAANIDGPTTAFGPDATFHLDLRDDARADAFLREHDLTAAPFVCVVPRLRYTPYWETHPERRIDPAEVRRRQAENDRTRDADHAKLRAAIVAWVEQTGNKVLLCPEMTYQVPLLRPLLFDPLPEAVRRKVVVRPRYWLPGEAASTYARAFAVVSCEMHSPIIAVANDTPAIHVRQPTDTRKGQMWRDVGLGDWLFEIDDTTGDQIARRLLAMFRDRDATRATVAAARRTVRDHGRRMMEAVGRTLGA